ncbi:zinc-dependent alcohol dehydrogenase [Fibrella forsythiae]|uniref:Alcohol dehydrogenase catalytic domain-containing protein n=1 Tax=Fibrella forsythiae TaxID=2817061 RepID=A0ABS3JDH3_9BACT|nr:alcohol dehydrogenase catalytic domain-containing protein [Fibrella forsythiae]MBO0948051.1 alcohol dehydrogenase catalytic domain-containing protein [Fibrella forsythiae]
MKAAFLQSPNQIQLLDRPLPEPGAGEVRVKLRKVGICGSDVHLFLGHRLLDKPTIIGHEGLGQLDKLGAGVTGRSVGERVVIEPNIPCRQCQYCWSGRSNICVNKRVIGVNEAGCFAEYIVLPADFCWHVPDSVSDADAVTVEPMAVALHALLGSSAKPGDTIAVIGLGAIGLLLTHLALSLGYRVFVTELNAAKRQLAETMGAVAVSPSGPPVDQQIAVADAWLANNVCAVFECAGTAATASLATAAVPRGAEVVLVGLSTKEATFTPLKIAREGIHIVPSIVYDHPADFRRTIQLIASRVIRPSFVISSQMELDNLQQALEIAALGDETKILITI